MLHSVRESQVLGSMGLPFRGDAVVYTTLFPDL